VLTKLCQITTIREYQIEFEKLANRMEGLDDAFYQNCFISGLKANIKEKVKMFKRETMLAIVGLAKLVKDKANA